MKGMKEDGMQTAKPWSWRGFNSQTEPCERSRFVKNGSSGTASMDRWLLQRRGDDLPVREVENIKAAVKMAIKTQ